MEHLNTRSVNLMKIWMLDSDVDKYENLMWKEKLDFQNKFSCERGAFLRELDIYKII